jgi:hypothetical protein
MSTPGEVDGVKHVTYVISGMIIEASAMERRLGFGVSRWTMTIAKQKAMRVADFGLSTPFGCPISTGPNWPVGRGWGIGSSRE